MKKKLRISTCSLIFLSLFIVNGILTYAQTTGTETVYSATKNNVQVTGATVRGTVVYEDTGRPVRYVSVTLVNTDDARSAYSQQYAKTDENGMFILKNVKAGTYYLYAKNKGILNPDVYESFDPDTKKKFRASLFQQVPVNGNGDFDYQFRVKRGGSISGIVRYADGEVAPNVKVEALRKIGDKFSAYSIRSLADAGESTTDDRGYYRFAGLPEGQYIVRAIEPASHKIEQEDYLGSSLSGDGKEYLQTYFPNGSTSKSATGIDVFFAQEQTSINITIPKRELYTVSGRVVLKKTGEALKNFEINFYKMDTTDEGLEYGNVARTSAAGFGFSDKEIPSEWSLRSLPKGKYRIVARQVKLYRSNNNEQPKYPDVEKEIEITDSNIENLLLEVQTGGSIKGVILDRDGKNLPQRMYLRANGESVEIDYSQYKENDPASQKQLSFEAHKLLAGEIRFRIFSDGYYLSQVFIGNRESENLTLDLKEGENPEDVRLIIASDLGTVKGRVANMENATEVGVYLIKKEAGTRENPRISFGSLAKANGTYEIKAAPGDYYIIVNDQSNRRRETPEEFYEKLRNLLMNASTVTIKPFETTDINLDMPK